MEVFDQFAPLLYGTLKQFRITHNREDALQEARLALWEAHRRYDPQQGDFAPYAARYVKGRIAHFLRKETAQTRSIPFAVLENEEAEVEFDPDDPTARQAYEAMEWQHVLANLRPALSEREALVIERHVFGGERLTDIAAAYNVSSDTVQTWKKRALKKIRQSVSRNEALACI